MIRYKDILFDNHARVPFSILGIFILLSSSLTSLYLSEIDMEKTDSILSLTTNKDIFNIVSNAENEISQIINIVGMKALQEIGQNPVIISRINGKTADDINRLRFKKSFIAYINPLLDDIFSENKYHNHRYAINILKNEKSQYCLDNLSMVNITPLSMELTRPLYIPLIGPDKKEEFETYWSISFPLTFEIIDLKEKKIIGYHPTAISRAITSRFPILYHLTKDYNDTLNGLGPLWGFFTSVVNVYSLVRGYRHFQSGIPRNVVDNKHLAPLINTGLLFEQGLCFGSIDPFSVVELLKNIRKSIFKQNSTDPIDTINALNSSSIDILTSWFTETSSDESEKDFHNFDVPSPIINISDITESILYDHTSIEIIFENKRTNELFSEILMNISNDNIRECMELNLDNDTILYDIKPRSIQFNKTTVDMITQLINDTYTAGFKTHVNRDQNPKYILGAHEGFPNDNGSNDWKINQMKITSISDKPSNGNIKIGSTMYLEQYDITWTREHVWSKKELSNTENNSTIKWTFHTTTDKKIEKNVSLEIILSRIGLTSADDEPIKDIFYKNTSLNDLNLEDTLQIYEEQVFIPNVHTLIAYSNGVYYDQQIQGWYDPRIINESIIAIQDILDIMENITVNSTINATRYPNPLILLTKSKENLLMKYQKLIPDMKNKSLYKYNGEFISTGKKAVYSSRTWFVDFTYDYINTVFHQMIDMITSAISTNSDAFDFSNQDQVLSHLNNKDEKNSFIDSFSIPFGVSMNLESLPMSSGLPWNESIQLSAHQTPSYLSPFYKEEYEGKKEYFLGIRNICVLGPTGLPILPITPTTPWVCSFNLWYISIHGSYAEFLLTDSNDETIPNPLFGHDSQIMIRKNKEIYDEHGNIIGLNTRISFTLDTMCFSIVPSFGMMIGDTENNIVEEHGFE